MIRACVLFFVLLVVNESFAKQNCRTCRGIDCVEEDVLQLDCSRFVPALPFESQLLINNDRGDLTYGCLDLEYYTDGTLDHIQQCIHTPDLQSFCDTLEYSLKVKSCSVGKPVSDAKDTKHIRSLSDMEKSADELQSVKVNSEVDSEPELGSGDPDSTTEGPPPSTTPSHADSVHFISFATVFSFLVMLVL